jgi:hypothetical protein
MTIEDFSNGFDVLLNSYNYGETQITLNEYEKSFFLTKAQDEEVTAIYSGKNPYGEFFEKTEEIRRYLTPLIKDAVLSPSEASDVKGVESNSKFFVLPADVRFITYESVKADDFKCGSDSSIAVFPVRQDEYQKLKKNPFRGAGDRRALRLDLSDNKIEIVSPYNVTSYYIKYLKKPDPIILATLDKEAAIEGKTEPSGCKLPESLHSRILERAVLEAVRSKSYGNTQEQRYRDDR